MGSSKWASANVCDLHRGACLLLRPPLPDGTSAAWWRMLSSIRYRVDDGPCHSLRRLGEKRRSPIMQSSNNVSYAGARRFRTLRIGEVHIDRSDLEAGGELGIAPGFHCKRRKFLRSVARAASEAWW